MVGEHSEGPFLPNCFCELNLVRHVSQGARQASADVDLSRAPRAPFAGSGAGTLQQQHHPFVLTEVLLALRGRINLGPDSRQVALQVDADQALLFRTRIRGDLDALFGGERTIGSCAYSARFAAVKAGRMSSPWPAGVRTARIVSSWLARNPTRTRTPTP